MIDIHCHILPGVDDGSPNTEESLKMAQIAVESGVEAIIVTPHCNLPENDSPLWADELLRRLEVFRRDLAQANIPLQVEPGMEIFGLPNTALLLQEGKLMPLAGSRYPLVEFPFTDYGREATALLDELLCLGYRPIVAHPERYLFTQAEPRLLNLWADMGCLLQLNRGSLLGRFGPGPEELALAMLDRGFPAFVASDAHFSTFRTPWLEDARQLIEDEYDPMAAQRLLEDNPRRILDNLDIVTEEPDWF